MSTGVLSRELAPGAFIELHSRFLATPIADAALATLIAEIPWQRGQITLFGRALAEPRLSAWFGPFDYTYSGRTVRAQALPPLVDELRRAIEPVAATRFNSVLLNLYRNGADSMGFHSDDEPELGPNPTIASLSLGATRRFVLEPKRDRRAAAATLELSHGSLLIMAGNCQHQFRHALPKSRSVTSPRVNLTFRYILPRGT